MSLFYSGAIALAILAILFIIWPFLSRRRLSAIATTAHVNEEGRLRETTNVWLYHDHLADIDQFLSEGSITSEQYQQLKLELERNLLQDSQQAKAEALPLTAQSGNGLFWWLVLAVVLLVSAGAIYTQLGAYDRWQIKTTLEQRTALQQEVIANPEGFPLIKPQITAINRQLVLQLEDLLGKSPDNLRMRTLLARTLVEQGNYAFAIEQFKQVLQRQPTASQIMAELAQAVFLQAGSRVVPIVQTLVDKVLKSDPNNTLAMGLAGIAAFQAENYQRAITIWQRAVVLQGADSGNAQVLLNGIEVAKKYLLAQTNAPLSNTVPAGADQAASAGTELGLTVQVSLGDAVTAAPQDTVFIYARAWQGARAPLAITRVQVAQLPLNVNLTNAMSMAPGMDLSSAEQLELVARVSTSGDPIPQPGDWQVTLGPIKLSQAEEQVYQLVIKDIIP